MRNKSLFSAREMEVLYLLSKGYSNSKIAKILFVSSHTIKAHVANMCQKANANGRLVLVLDAYKNGILKI